MEELSTKTFLDEESVHTIVVLRLAPIIKKSQLRFNIITIYLAFDINYTFRLVIITIYTSQSSIYIRVKLSTTTTSNNYSLCEVNHLI